MPVVDSAGHGVTPLDQFHRFPGGDEESPTTERNPRIGVFGGTFDPVHIGHLIIAADLQHRLRLDRVLFVPAGRPPHKNSALISSDEDRLEMLTLALRDEPGAEVSTLDLERPGPSFTVDLLRTLHNREPGAGYVFLMGQDSLRDFPHWRNPETIVALAELGVAARPGVAYDVEELFAAVPASRGRVTLSPALEIGISATTIRKRVADNEPIRHMTPAAVEDFIRRRGLYLEPE